MKIASVTGAIIATLALAGAAVATPPGGMPDQAKFGLCRAWSAMEGEDNPGNAPGAPPFQWLQDQAEEEDQSVSEWCAQNAPHPGNGNGNNGNNGNGGGPPF